MVVQVHHSRCALGLGHSVTLSPPAVECWPVPLSPLLEMCRSHLCQLLEDLLPLDVVTGPDDNELSVHQSVSHGITMDR